MAEKSVGMTDAQKAQYWYELSQAIFALLGKVEVTISSINGNDWRAVAMLKYPSLTEVRLADSTLYITSEADLARILSLDWTSLVPYLKDKSDCDDYSTRLFNHLCDYYGITGVVPVWGDTTQGYHAFNLAVFSDLTAKLIEPQTDQIFVIDGPLGMYTPRFTALEYGIKRGG